MQTTCFHTTSAQFLVVYGVSVVISSCFLVWCDELRSVAQFEGVSELANTYVLGIIDGTYVGMCEDTGTI